MTDNRIQEIKRHWEEMARYPNANPAYAFAVSDIAYLLKQVEKAERDNFTLRKNQEYVLEPKIIDMNNMINDLAADKLIAEQKIEELEELDSVPVISFYRRLQSFVF